MIEFLILIISMFVNKFRGGGFYAHYLPGAPRYYIFPIIGILFYISSFDIFNSVIFALLWLLWSIPPWGRYYTLGRFERSISTRTPNKIELFIENLVSKIKNRKLEDHILFFLRNFIVLIPLIYFSYLAPLIIAIFISLSYEIAWRLFSVNQDNNAINVAEYLTGFVWGCAILFLA